MPSSTTCTRTLSSWLPGLAALALCACASTPLVGTVAAPKLAVGDHWQYRIADGLRRGAVTQLDAEVVAVAAGTATIRLTYSDDSGRTEQTAEIDADGGLRLGALKARETRRFSPPVKLLDFPLEQGKTWRQVIDTMRGDNQLGDQILVYGNVRGREPVTVPAGTFEPVYVYRIFQLDDNEFWRTRTTRRDQVWYAADVKAPVREVHDAEYLEKSDRTDITAVRTEHTTAELVLFKPGPK